MMDMVSLAEQQALGQATTLGTYLEYQMGTIFRIGILPLVQLRCGTFAVR